MHCQHLDYCGNCPWMHKPLLEQKAEKIQILENRLLSLKVDCPSQIAFHLPASLHIRDRVDLTFVKKEDSPQFELGFYNRLTDDIFTPTECPIMSPALFQLFEQVRKIDFSIKKGSVRLRVSPIKSADFFGKGIWLDFANEDIKNLFEEKQVLLQLLKIGYVEVGQKRKKLVFDSTENKFRLKDPEPQPWTETYLFGPADKNTAIPLYSFVGSFSQTGSIANKVLLERVTDFIQKSQGAGGNWVEFGSGNGNFTVPLSAHAKTVLAVEYDALLSSAFEKTIHENNLSEKIKIETGDFQQKKSVDFSNFDGVLVNPPRSGLKNFLKPMTLAKSKPKSIVAISCFVDTFAEDASQIQELGYTLKQLEIVDQFPHSGHFEIISLFEVPAI